MEEIRFTIIENKALTASVYRLRLGGNTSAITAPGQFVNIKLEGKFLRRPISVCDRSGSMLTLIYKTVGAGTEQLSTMKKGEQLDLLTGLGNGYDLTPSGEHPLLIGGGVGVPPLFGLADDLLQKGCRVTAILGFNTADEIFYADEFRQLGAEVFITTVDGSAGIKGFVTDAMKALDYSYFYACGPEPMLKAVYRTSKTEGQLSFEKRMGCGFGACMGCSCRTVTGWKRICKEGPVLRKEEILWEN